MRRILISTVLLALLVGAAHPQQAKVRWRRSRPAVTPPLQLFHSTHAGTLPTAEQMRKGDLEFLVAHRFVPAISEGPAVLYGLDGPAYNRLALTYAISNRAMMTVGRSSLADNVDFSAKVTLLEHRGKHPLLAAFLVGSAWNTQPIGQKGSSSRNIQAFFLGIVNTMIGRSLGLGIVPAYLWNSDIYAATRHSSVTLGGYVQVYFARFWSVLAEWNPAIAGSRNGYNSFSLAIELETGGHFFKILAGNNLGMNLSQYLSGAGLPISMQNFRLGFMITRLIKL